MRTRVVLILTAMAPLLSATLNAQSVPEVGQGPPTRRDSRWRIQQERADYVRDVREEANYLMRHRSIAEVVPFTRRVAQRGLVSLSDRYGFARHGLHRASIYGLRERRYIPVYPFVPLYLRPELLLPQRQAKRGLMRLGNATEPVQQGPALASLVEQLPLLVAALRDYDAPRRRAAESDYDTPPPRERPRLGLNTESKDVPDYCFSGDGHPLGGREWCYRHGYEVGGGWMRESGHNVALERPRSPITRAELAASIGADLTIELDAQRVRLGLSEPLIGSYVATLENGAVLKVRSGRSPIAEISDRDRDGRADAIWRRNR